MAKIIYHSIIMAISKKNTTFAPGFQAL